MCKARLNIALFTDLHSEIMHDSPLRIATFLEECRLRSVDVIVQLGDIGYPAGMRELKCQPCNTPANLQNALTRADSVLPDILEMLHSSDIPVLSLLGNHDLDFSDTDEAVKRLRMPHRYYTRELGGVQLILLDCNSYLQDGQYLHYDHGNYMDHPGTGLSVIDPEQLEWLSLQLNAAAGKPTLVLSHQSLNRELYGISNHREVHAMLRRKQLDGAPLISINGHSHIDLLSYREQIAYWNLNSISNAWLGEDYATERYGLPIDDQYPNICYTAPYSEPLFCFVKVFDHGLHLQGRSGSFVGASPNMLGFPARYTQAPVTPCVSSLYLGYYDK